MSTTRPARSPSSRKTVKTPQHDASSSTSRPAIATQAIVWHRSAPSDVAGAGFWGHESPGWKAWARYLSGRRSHNVSRLFPKRSGNPLTWVRHADDSWVSTLALVDGLLERTRKGPGCDREADAEARAWMLQADPQAAPAAYAMECLAWAYALPKLSQRLSAEVWWELLDCLYQAIQASTEPAIERNAEARLLLAGELPLVLAYQFPELRWPRRLRNGAKQTVSQCLLAATESGGWWLAGHTAEVWGLTASWLRCRLLARKLKRSWDEPAERRFQSLLVNACRFARPDGTLPLAGDSSGAATPGLLSAVQAALSNPAARRVAACSLEKLAGAKRGAAAVPKKLPAASHAEEAGLAVLRTSWRSDADRVTVDFTGAMPELEVSAGSRTLLRGPWDVNVQVDGQPIHLAGPWEVLCWHSDKDVDYLELEADYQDDLVVGRHMLLAKKDRWLLLADSVIGQRGERVAYRGDLPLADGVQFAPQTDTCEGRLECRKQAALALPLALPEWRSDRRVGEFQCQQRQLTLLQQGRGHRLFAPLLIDLDARRAGKQRTWRQLTVAQNREILTGEMAAAFRAQIGDEQWLIYRSLTGRANRTVLGHNLVTEFLAARFTRRGTTKQLLEIA